MDEEENDDDELAEAYRRTRVNTLLSVGIIRVCWRRFLVMVVS